MGGNEGNLYERIKKKKEHAPTPPSRVRYLSKEYILYVPIYIFLKLIYLHISCLSFIVTLLYIQYIYIYILYIHIHVIP